MHVFFTIAGCKQRLRIKLKYFVYLLKSIFASGITLSCIMCSYFRTCFYEVFSVPKHEKNMKLLRVIIFNHVSIPGKCVPPEDVL